MAVSQANIQSWFAANPGATDAQVAQAMQQNGVGTAQVSQTTGVGLDDVTRRFNLASGLPEYNNRLNPAFGVPGGGGGGSVTPVDAGYSPEQVGDKQQEEMMREMGFTDGLKPLSSAPLGGGAAGGRAVGNYGPGSGLAPGGGRDNTGADPYRPASVTPRPAQPVFEMPTFGAPAPMPAAAPASAMPGMVPLTDPTRYNQKNPYLDQMGDSITDQVNQNLSRNMLPQIGSQAVSSGNFGGSRQGVVEANAFRDANGQLANALTGMRFGDYNNTMQRQLQQYGMDQSYNLGQGNLALGNKNSDNSFALGQGNLALGNRQADQSYALGQGNLALGNKTADNSFTLGQGNLQLGNKNSDQSYNLGLGNLQLGNKNSDQSFELGQGNLQLGNKTADNSFTLGQGNLQLGNKNSDQGFALGVGNLGLGFQNSDNAFALGQGNLQLGNKQADQGFYTQQRGQDLQQVGLGASLFGQGNNGMLSQGQGAYNLGLTQQNAPGQAMQGFNGVAGPYTGFGSTTSSQQGSQGAGFVGGALAGSQMYNIFSNGNSNPMGIQNTDGFTNTPNYLRFPA